MAGVFSMIRGPRSTWCPTLMWKAGDQADTNVDSAYCRGTTVLRRVALKSGGCRALCVHSEGLARTANQGTRRDFGHRRQPRSLPYVSVVEALRNFRIVATAFSAGGPSCPDFECGARLRASPRGGARARRLSPGTTRVRGGRHRHPRPRAREQVGRQPFQPALKRWRFSWNSYVPV
jgi:hypothetical protein